jgi:hypothetical protein
MATSQRRLVGVLAYPGGTNVPPEPEGLPKCHSHTRREMPGMGVGTGGLSHFSDPPSATPIPYLEWG